MSDRSRYDHATELSISQTPVSKLAYLAEELKAWAKLNPGLRPLQEEFVRVLGEFREQERRRNQHKSHVVLGAAGVIDRDGVRRAECMGAAPHDEHEFSGGMWCPGLTENGGDPT